MHAKNFEGQKFLTLIKNGVNDYISEKFWRNALGAQLVPVVYGPHPDDVKRVAPPNSYIHAEDFESPESLVEYLDYLDKNDSGMVTI